MTLLQKIAAAASAADSGDLSPHRPTFPLILKPAEVPQNPNPNFPQITKSPNWTLSGLDSEVSDLLAGSIASLHKTLNNFDKFVSVLNSLFKKLSSKTGITVKSFPNKKDPLDLKFTLAAVEKLESFIVPELAALIAEACVGTDLFETLISRGFLKKLTVSFNLIEKFAEKNRSDLLCFAIRMIPNLRPSEIYAYLKFFLLPNEESYQGMVAVKKEWEKQALLAVDLATKKANKSKNGQLSLQVASILLMMAHDSFHSSETCLHYMFATNIDDLVLASAVSKLDGHEVLSLVRYFIKWVEKYERFPEARRCYNANEYLGLTACDWVPSLESVSKGLSLVLDEHFSYLVLNPEFRDELEAAKKTVESLALEAELCGPVDDIIKHLKSRTRKNMEVDG